MILIERSESVMWKEIVTFIRIHYTYTTSYTRTRLKDVRLHVLTQGITWKIIRLLETGFYVDLRLIPFSLPLFCMFWFKATDVFPVPLIWKTRRSFDNETHVSFICVGA